MSNRILVDVSSLLLYPLPIFTDNYVWLLINPGKKTVTAVDPGDCFPVHEWIQSQGLQLEALLITHHHFDHTGGIKDLKARYSVPVYGPGSVPGVTHGVSEPDYFTLPSLPDPISVINIPGHTQDHIAYVSSGRLFCGDTLFSAGCGRLFEGTAEQMLNSLQKLTALPDQTLVYCGHEYTMANLKFAAVVEPNNQAIHNKLHQVLHQRQTHTVTLPSTMGQEKTFNPFLRCHIPAVIHAVEQQCGQKLNFPADVFQALREWKNQF